MKYIPCTKEEEQEILETIGITSFNELLKIVPEKLRLKNKYGIGDSMSEIELINHMNGIASKNTQGVSFLGAGAYDRYVPTIVDFIASRSEFYTAYTPYQAEVSQGTLQYIYEYQSMICSLTGMDASNASLYDGASAVAEAAIMSNNHNSKNTILVSPYLNRSYLSVLSSTIKNLNLKIKLLPKSKNGVTDISNITKYIDEDTSCVIIQSPNFLGQIEDWKKVKESISEEMLLIGVSDPITLSSLKSPGNSGVDIYVGEGQGLGNHLSYGGPYLGIISVKQKLIRKLPGRIVGKTCDASGNIGYTLTLQTREQHIRRERATSNICTNQGLMALRATIYLSLMGALGLKEINNLCLNKAYYLASEINNIDGFSLVYVQNFINEFVIKTDFPAKKVAEHCAENNIFIHSLNDSKILIAVTEKRTKEQIDSLISTLKDFK